MSRERRIHFVASHVGEAQSTMANLQARCEDRGDHFILNGSKIWTSYGDLGDWMFCLVRTDFEAPKHQGISFVMFDMATPGVSTRPIRLISGKSPFTETFFEDVRVEKDQVIGELNKGWTVAKYLLTHEREMIAASGLTVGYDPEFCEHAERLEDARTKLALGRAVEYYLGRLPSITFEPLKPDDRRPLPADHPLEKDARQHPEQMSGMAKWYANPVVKTVVEAFNGEIEDVRE